jgi:hypothetical protein
MPKKQNKGFGATGQTGNPDVIPTDSGGIVAEVTGSMAG